MSKNTIIQLGAMGAAAGVLYWLGHRTAAAVLAGMMGLVLLLALVAPATLHTLQQLLQRLVSAIATGIGLVLLTIVYFSIFLPGALWLRIRNIDVLNRSFPSQGRSNWIDRVGYGTDKLLYEKPYTRPHGRGPGT